METKADALVLTEEQPQQETQNALEVKTLITEQYVEGVGKQIELRAKLLQLALKALKPHDIQDFDGKPYIEGEGAARMMAVVRGFRVGEPKFNIDLMAPHYFIECEIPIEFMGAKTVALGDCSTSDAFFTGKEGDRGLYGKHLSRVGSEQMAARLILGDAKKKARENAISRGVTELLGLKGLTWDDLAALGFSRANAGANIAFRKGAMGGASQTQSMAPAAPQQQNQEADAVAVCSECNAEMSDKVANYSITKYGRLLCFDCQKKVAGTR